jgi:hypothetical protein
MTLFTPALIAGGAVPAACKKQFCPLKNYSNGSKGPAPVMPGEYTIPSEHNAIGHMEIAKPAVDKVDLLYEAVR